MKHEVLLADISKLPHHGSRHRVDFAYRSITPLTNMTKIVFLIVACLIAVQVQAASDPKDRPGCQDSPLLTRMTGCWTYQCDKKSYHTYLMPIVKNDNKNNVEGEYEFVRYECPGSMSGLEIIRNAEAALKKSGYKLLYSDNDATGGTHQITARSGPQWVYVFARNKEYEIRTVKTKQMEQVMEANAAGWGQQIGETGRASIYGINFDTGKATIRPDSEPVLKEVLALLQSNPTWAMIIAGHTDNVGAKDMNLTLSRQRAESVIAWLVSQGIDKTRLAPAGFGDTRPVEKNSTEEGRAKNRRVDLVKIY
jgi:OOP family OmpA-OmpF porin